MAEFKQYSHDNVVEFMAQIGFPIYESDIIQVFPMMFSDRRVIRVKNGFQDQVLKIRPNNDSGRKEAEKLKLLFASYSYSGGRFSPVEIASSPDLRYLKFRMPYLGRNFVELGTSLNLIELGQSTAEEEDFTGFTSQQITRLINNLAQSQRQFASQRGFIHGDFMQTKSPNNVVYHSQLDRLFLVDAEAMATFSEPTAVSFDRQIKDLEEWMCQNFLIS